MQVSFPFEEQLTETFGTIKRPVADVKFGAGNEITAFLAGMRG